MDTGHLANGSLGRAMGDAQDSLNEAAIRQLQVPGYGFNYMAKRGRSIVKGFCNQYETLKHRLGLLKDWDCYVCLNPAKQGVGKPAQEDVALVKWFVLDIDPVIEAAEPKLATAALLAYLDMAYDIKNYTMVATGRGYHLWIPINDEGQTPSALQGGVKGFVATIAATFGICCGCKIDTSCAEISRVVRIPGTINQKTGKVAEAIVIADLDARQVPAEMLLDVAINAPAATGTLEGEPELKNIAPSLPWYAAEFLLLGVRSDLDSRHSRGFAAAKALAELGVDQTTARFLLEGGCLRCNPPLLDLDWVLRTIRRAYGQEA